MQSVRTAVVGASGYSGQELIRYLARHPAFELCLVTSRQQAGEPLSLSIPGLSASSRQLKFVDAAPGAELAGQAELFFLALPHGAAAPYAIALRAAGKIVVDLSADFRTRDNAIYREFYDQDHPAPELLKEAVYGLPEVHREELKTAMLVASPGCFPTSILLPLIPLLRASALVNDSIAITSLSGVSGAGRKLELRLLFGEVADNMYAYGAPKHRHLGEIEQELSLAAGEKVTVSFVPHLVPMQRGMITTISAKLTQPASQPELQGILEQAYAGEPFIEIVEPPAFPEARQVAHSNRARVGVRVDERTNRVLLFSTIDNLGKGAASQAIQAANIACGISETAGLEG